MGVCLLVGASVILFLVPRPFVDFQAYFDAAVRLATTGSPYQQQTLDGQWHSGTVGLYVYSPVLALLLVPWTALPPDAAAIIWLVARVGLIALTCALMPVPRWTRVAILAVCLVSGPFIRDLQYGNVSIIVAFFAVVTWRWLDRPLGSAAMAASILVRPVIGVVAIWWLVRRKWSAAIWFGFAILALFLVSLVFIGLDPWLQWITVLRNLGDELGVHGNLDLGTAALTLGAPRAIASLVLIVGYLLAIVAIIASLRRDRQVSFAVTLTATLLLSPLMWDHYLTVLIVPAALIAARGRPLFVLLPLLLWLPDFVTPLIVVATMWLIFIVPDSDEPAVDPPWSVWLRRLRPAGA